MGIPFVTHAPTAADTELFSLLLSTFLDGTGNQRDQDGGTRANWREIERCVAEFVDALGGENKGIFDVIAKDPAAANVHYGLSVKSKQYSKTTLDDLDASGRVYMEVANSPAKFWDAIGLQHGLAELDYRNQVRPQDIGDCVLATVESWHAEGKRVFEHVYPGKTLDLAKSCYFSLTYSKTPSYENRKYQVHVFPLTFPRGVRWAFSSGKCLRGYDPAFPTEALFDWYALSGGQLKYYPKASTAIYRSEPFGLTKPEGVLTVMEKARVYFPEAFARLRA